MRMDKELFLPPFSEVVGKFVKLEEESLTLSFTREMVIGLKPDQYKKLAEQIQRLHLKPGDLVGILNLGNELKIRRVRE